MLEKEQLRKADVITGLLFFLFGVFILSQAFKMPMTDSWGGVQNVWYVSPALFPLFIGGMIAFLGAILTIKAALTVGLTEIKNMFSFIFSEKLINHITNNSSIRFIAIAILFIFFVYMSVPRVDFVLCSLQFLIVFITMFYFDSPTLLLKLLTTHVILSCVQLAYFLFIHNSISQSVPFAADYLTIILIIIYAYKAWSLSRSSEDLKKKFKTVMIISCITPLVLAGVFKYFLLVPLIHEGLMVTIFDAIRYM